MSREALPATARILRAIRNSSKRQASEAIAEWVDNALGETRGNASNVWIDHKAKKLSVRDDGRAPDKLGDVVQLGAGAASGGWDTGRFGWGGSIAQLTFADSTEMWALRDGFVAHDRVPWTRLVHDEQWPSVDSAYGPNLCPRALANQGHGFLMEMHLRKEMRVHDDIVQKYLAREFAPALIAGRRIYWNGSAIDAWRPPQLDDIVSTTFEVYDPDTDEPGLWVELEAGWSDQLPADEMGLDIIYGPRRVGRTKKPMQGYRGPTIYGTLSLRGAGDWLSHLDSEKKGIATDSLRKQLDEQCRQALAPLMDSLRALVRNQALIAIGGDIAKALSKIASAGRTGAGDQLGFPDTSTWVVKGGRRTKRDGEARNRSSASRTIHIDPASDEFLSGAAWWADLPLNDDWQIFLNEEIPAFKKALEEMPPDRPILHNALGSAIAVGIIGEDPNLLWELRIYTHSEYESLLLGAGGNASALVPYVVRKLLSAIDTTPTGKSA